MKRIKYIFIFAISILAFIACDSNDTDGVIYDAKNSEASFAKTTSSYNFGANDPDRYEVVLQRGNANGASSIPVTIDDGSGFFSAPASVDFADGAYEAKIPVTFDRSKLVVGKAYSVALTIPENPIKERTVKHTLSITRDYVWNYFKDGVFTSDLFGDWDQEIQKADGAEAYKLPSLYANGVDFIFYVAEDGTISLPGTTNANGYYRFTTGYVHSSYGMMYLYMDPDPDYSLFIKAEKTAVFSNYYYVSAGNFGWFDDVLTWE
jgi:hypothetical protein